jgi:uncharacterized LabA/DUF88 family protein
MAQNPTEKIIILIDGGNTHGALFKDRKDKQGNMVPAILKKGERFDYKAFAHYLADGRKIIDIRYYIGIVRDHDHTTKSQMLVRSQQKFLQQLENDGLLIERGRVVYDHVIREKGVDVKIAVDYDTAILISPDSDLVPAVKQAIAKGKKIQYIGFDSRISMALMNEASIRRVFARPDLIPFIK